MRLEEQVEIPDHQGGGGPAVSNCGCFRLQSFGLDLRLHGLYVARFEAGLGQQWSSRLVGGGS